MKRYNQLCVHYNLVADGVYKARASINDLFDTDYLPYIVAALISFDLGRMMGDSPEKRYALQANGFAGNLYGKLQHIRTSIGHLTNVGLCNANLPSEKANIVVAYDELASGGKNSLHQKGKQFHVGATKILHFINPELFVIIDRNTARAFRASHGISYQDSTQPGYSAEKYFNCLEYAKTDMINFGVKEFCSLEKGSPIARIYDKLSYATGAGWF